MEPIRSFWDICLAHGLPPSQIITLQALLKRRMGVLHPYWIQLALFVPYGFASVLHDGLVANEWAVSDLSDVEGSWYESELTDMEVEALAFIELVYMDEA